MENFISPLRFKKSNYVIRLFSNKPRPYKKKTLFGKKSKNTFGFLRPTAEFDFPFFSWGVWEAGLLFGPNNTTHEIDS